MEIKTTTIDDQDQKPSKSNDFLKVFKDIRMRISTLFPEKNKKLLLKFKQDAYYRIIWDEEGYLDAINSGVIRPNQEGSFKWKQTYYTRGIANTKDNPVRGSWVKPWTYYAGKYIVEVLPNDKHFPKPTKNLSAERNFGSTMPGQEIPIYSEFVNIYKYNKLTKKYVQIDLPRSPNKH